MPVSVSCFCLVRWRRRSSCLPVSVSCFCHVRGEGGDPVCLCQFPAPGTLREKEEILHACVSFLLLPRYGRRRRSCMPVSVSCSCHVKEEGGDPVCLCQFPAPATLREKEELRWASVPPRCSRLGACSVLEPMARWSTTGLRGSLAESPHG